MYANSPRISAPGADLKVTLEKQKSLVLIMHENYEVTKQVQKGVQSFSRVGDGHQIITLNGRQIIRVINRVFDVVCTK